MGGREREEEGWVRAEIMIDNKETVVDMVDVNRLFLRIR